MGNNMQKNEKWDFFDHINIRGQLSLSDSSYFYDLPLIFDLNPGMYKIEFLYDTLDDQRYIARARVSLSDERQSLGNQLGILVVDFGQVGVCDRESMESAFDALGDNGMSIYFDQLNITTLTGRVELPSGVKMCIFRPSFGDGNYPVYELLGRNGENTGVEIDFLCDMM